MEWKVHRLTVTTRPPGWHMKPVYGQRAELPPQELRTWAGSMSVLGHATVDCEKMCQHAARFGENRL